MDFPNQFLDDKNVAGQTLLQLVARGNSILAEMLRLSDHIPGVFTGRDQREATKYSEIIFDFSYLKKQDKCDAKIESNELLMDLDDEFRESHIDILKRFYELFESIVRYHSDFKQYMNNVQDGLFLQYSRETLLNDPDGIQLITEAVYLYGVMLLVMDLKIKGSVREKLIVAYYRYRGSIIESTIRDVAKLCRGTGFGPDNRRPRNYPEKYFARFGMDKGLIDMIVGKLRGQDIYHAGLSYPEAHHRTTMLSNQASMLFVILFFRPHTLDKEEATMRGIVDRFFSDNWVVPLYMGMLMDLNQWWKQYGAASKALKNTINKENVANIIQKHVNLIKPIQKELKKFLTEGVLTEESVMRDLTKLMHWLRNFNVFLRWIMMHRIVDENASNEMKKYQQSIMAILPKDRILLLLVKLAQFEYKLKTILQGLLQDKLRRWNKYQKECFDRMVELSEYFSGDKPLTRIKKNAKLQSWFVKLSEEIKSLSVDGNKNVIGGKIIKIIHELDQVQTFHQIDQSLQIKQFLADTKTYLKKMTRIAMVREDVIGTISIVSDFSYAWEIMDDYVDLMQLYIRRDAKFVLLLRATFLKMVSILDAPLVRINECNSEDLVSVSAYYSEKLVAFVRSVLDIVPKTMFDMLARIAILRQQQLPILPLKFERKYMREKASLSARYHLADTTHKISVFAQGILDMKTTLFGVIEVEPQQLLEDGIRKELVRRISHALNDTLKFGNSSSSSRSSRSSRSSSSGSSSSSQQQGAYGAYGADALLAGRDLDSALISIGDHLGAFQQSFEHIQDYIKVYGLKVWQEEFARIINYYVEQESNRFLRRKTYDEQSQYQSEAIPIPPFLHEKTINSNNFTGRVVNELLSKTHYRQTIFADFRQAWYVPHNFRMSIGIRTFHLILQGLGVVGLNGLDKLVGFMIVSNLQKFIKSYSKMVGSDIVGYVSQFRSKIGALDGLPRAQAGLAKRLYRDYAAHGRLKQFWPVFSERLLSVGQKQLIRRQMNSTLTFQARIDSKVLTCSLEAVNLSVLGDVTRHYRQPSRPYPSEDNPLLANVCEYLDFVGLNNPLAKIYITSDPLEGLETMLFLYLVHEMDQLEWLPYFGCLGRVSVKNKNDVIDGTALVVGLITLLKQFHPRYTEQLLKLLCQYVRVYINEEMEEKITQNVKQQSKGGSGSKSFRVDMPKQATNTLHLLSMMVKYNPFLERKQIEAYLPSYLLDNY